MTLGRVGIRLVTFDVGGTLIHPNPTVGTIYAEVLTRRGFACGPSETDRAFEESWRCASLRGPALGRGQGSGAERIFWGALLEAVVRRLGGEAPPEGAADELFEQFSRKSAWRIYEDVVPTLENLAVRGLPMAVVSNWDSRLPGLLRELGLRRYFGPLVVSSLEACEKPDPRIFHLAAGRAGVLPSEILHVGDQDREDCEGALAAGCRAFKVERSPKGGGGLEAILEHLTDEESGGGGEDET